MVDGDAVKTTHPRCMPSAKFLPRHLNLLHKYRERIADEIVKTREKISIVKTNIAELNQIKLDLAAIDRTLALHDIAVDPIDIAPVHNHYRRLDLQYGELSRCIYKVLRENGIASHTQIFESIAARHPHLVPDEASVRQLKRSIHDRLKALASEGRVRRHHDVSSKSKCGIWSFPPTDS